MIACIPSKGRPNTSTHKLFESLGIDAIHFVEPQDLDLYKNKKCVSIKKNDMGIGYARQYIIDYCKKNKIDWCIMCDDDIDSFGYVEDGKCIKKDASIFFDMIKIASKLPFEMYGMSFRQYAWSENKKYSINSKVFTAVSLINIPNIKWKYENTFKEDIQFLMDGIRLGNGQLKFNHFFFNCPPIGTNKGGCFDGYVNKEDEKSITSIMNKYKGYTSVVNKKDRKDVKWYVRQWAVKHKKKTL